MTTGRRVRVTSDDASEVRDAVLALEPRPDEMVAVFVAPQGAPDLEAVGAALARTEHSFFGGLFPRLVDGAEIYDAGVLAFTLPRLGEPMLARHLDIDDFDVPDCAALAGSSAMTKPTAVVLADGMTSNISRFLEAIYNQLGGTVSYWGGGAGISARIRKPCIMTRAGVYRMRP
jgi:hypothetical protein